jgi:hypothetical protein
MHTALYYLDKWCEESKQLATVSDLIKKYDIPTNLNLSGALSSVAIAKFATKKINKEGKREYKITASGLKKIATAACLDKVLSPEDMQIMSGNVKVEAKEKSKLKAKGGNVVISKTITPKANEAINGISMLVEENQRLNAILKGIYLQLGKFFEEDNNNEQTSQG